MFSQTLSMNRFANFIVLGMMGLIGLMMPLFGQAQDRSIIVQSTTSTQNSGLYAHILPIFTKATGIKVKIVAVGTGQAIKNARNGDGDVLLVHAKAAEEQFIEDGYGVTRHDLMVNDFVLIGSKQDEALVKNASSITKALQNIAASQSIFISRGDESGTHKKETSLWRQAGISPKGAWYRQTGSGMGASLNMASAMDAYILSDRASWVAFANKGDLTILFENDKGLTNQYGVMLVNPKRHSHVNSRDGQIFIDWLLSKTGQDAINGFRIKGKQLFFANADNS